MNDINKVLFVCTGNIIRSPLAENMLRQLAEQEGLDDRFEVDSAGTSGYHSGQLPDSRMRETAAKHGVEYGGSARQIKAEDLAQFDLIVAMDRSNHRNILALANGAEEEAKVRFMREWDPQAQGDMDVPDPYYGGMDGFEQTYQIVARSVEGLLGDLTGNSG